MAGICHSAVEGNTAEIRPHGQPGHGRLSLELGQPHDQPAVDFVGFIMNAHAQRGGFAHFAGGEGVDVFICAVEGNGQGCGARQHGLVPKPPVTVQHTAGAAFRMPHGLYIQAWHGLLDAYHAVVVRGVVRCPCPVEGVFHQVFLNRLTRNIHRDGNVALHGQYYLPDTGC